MTKKEFGKALLTGVHMAVMIIVCGYGFGYWFTVGAQQAGGLLTINIEQGVAEEPKE